MHPPWNRPQSFCEGDSATASPFQDTLHKASLAQNWSPNSHSAPLPTTACVFKGARRVCSRRAKLACSAFALTKACPFKGTHGVDQPIGAPTKEERRGSYLLRGNSPLGILWVVRVGQNIPTSVVVVGGVETHPPDDVCYSTP